MELSFVTKAVRRYWWVVAAFVALGLAGATLLERDSGPVYETSALVLVSPSGSSGLGAGATDDRYITSQLVLFESGSLADQVATDMPGQNTGTDIRQASTFVQLPGTDVVRITVQTGNSETSAAIANGYVDAYLEALRAQLEESQAPELEAINNAIDNVESELGDVNAEIDDVLDAYRPTGPVSPDQAEGMLTIEQINPSLATRRETLVAQQIELVGSRNEIELGTSSPKVTSRVIQRASEPVEPVVPGRRTALLAAPLAGLLFGTLAAVLIARLSPRVLDSVEVGETLGVPMAAELEYSRTLAHKPAPSVERFPRHLLPSVREVCVQAEAVAQVGGILSIAVVGADRRAGTTTLASAMAGACAAGGAEVILIDADPGDPTLTRTYASETDGLDGLLKLSQVNQLVHNQRAVALPIGRENHGGDATTDSADRHPEVFADTPLERLRVVGLGDPSVLRRRDVSDVIWAASQFAQIVVIDGGPLMEAASSIQLAQLADAVVVAVPVKWQRRQSLDVVRRQLSGSRGRLLPVATPTHPPRRWGWSRRPGGSDR